MEKSKLILFALLGIFLIGIVSAVSVKVLYNPYTQKLDYILNNVSWSQMEHYPVACPTNSSITTLNDSVTCTQFVGAGVNVTADYIFGDGSGLSNVGALSEVDTYWTQNYTNQRANNCSGSVVIGIYQNGTFACEEDNTGSAGTGKSGDGIYLYNDSDTLYLNETKLNISINLLDDDTTYSAGSNITLTGTTFAVNTTGLLEWLGNVYQAVGSYLTSAVQHLSSGDNYIEVNASTGSVEITLNMTEINATIDDRDSGETYTHLSNFTNNQDFWNDTYATFNKTYADTIYAGIGAGNSSWNETHANTLYAGIEWDYNQTLATYNAYNTAWLSTYNATYEAGSNSSWNETHANTLYADISVVDTNCTVDGFCTLILYDSDLPLANRTTIAYQNITNIPTCAGDDKLTFDGSILSCASDVSGAGGKIGRNPELNNDSDEIFINQTWWNETYITAYSESNLNVNNSNSTIWIWGLYNSITNLRTALGFTNNINFTNGNNYWNTTSNGINTTFTGATYSLITEPLWTNNLTNQNASWTTTFNTTYNAYNSSGWIIDWNASSYIIDWNSTGQIKNWNESGWIADWNSLGYIKDWNSTGYIKDWSGDFATNTKVDSLGNFTAWDNITGIPTATPSDGDTTHFSLADEIYDWVIGLGYLDSLSNIFDQVLNTTSAVSFKNVTVAKVIGESDIDTYINWSSDDQLEFFAGGISFIHLIEGAGDGIAFNQDSNDIDWRVESDSHTHALAVDGGTNKVRMENYTNCDTLDTDATGILSCGTDADGFASWSNVSDIALNWDGLDTPADINAADITDDGTYLTSYNNLTEDNVEDYIFDDDNTADLNMSSYNVVGVNCINFTNGATWCTA